MTRCAIYGPTLPMGKHGDAGHWLSNNSSVWTLEHSIIENLGSDMWCPAEHSSSGTALGRILTWVGLYLLYGTILLLDSTTKLFHFYNSARRDCAVAGTSVKSDRISRNVIYCVPNCRAIGSHVILERTDQHVKDWDFRVEPDIIQNRFILIHMKAVVDGGVCRHSRMHTVWKKSCLAWGLEFQPNRSEVAYHWRCVVRLLGQRPGSWEMVHHLNL